MIDTKQHYSDLLNLADGLIDNLAGLIEKMPPPETTRANWGHIGTLLGIQSHAVGGVVLS